MTVENRAMAAAAARHQRRKRPCHLRMVPRPPDAAPPVAESRSRSLGRAEPAPLPPATRPRPPVGVSRRCLLASMAVVGAVLVRLGLGLWLGHPGVLASDLVFASAAILAGAAIMLGAGRGHAPAPAPGVVPGDHSEREIVLTDDEIVLINEMTEIGQPTAVVLRFVQPARRD